MADLQIDIVTPTALAFTGTASTVLVPGWDGQFEVQSEHATVLSLLRGGITAVTTAAGETRYITGRGFVEAGPDRAVILVDSCTPVADADSTTALADITAAEAKKAQTHDGSADWVAAEEAVELAQARLDK